MAGQAAQSFDPTPGRRPEVGSVARGPSVNTQQFRATPAQYTNNGRGLAALGDALGGFFNTAAKIESAVDEINHREDLVQIQRENEALAKQGVVDAELGRPMDSSKAPRRSYAEAFQTTSADRMAYDMGQGLDALLAKQPLDGSVDIRKVAEDYFREQVGNGSGDVDYDARLLSRYTQYADQRVAQYSEAQRTTILQNSTQETVRGVVRQILSPEGMTTAAFAEARARIGALVNGNEVARDKILMSAIAEGVQNDGQGVSVLQSMQEMGMDKSQPELFNRISGEVLKRTNAVKTYDAGVALDNWRQDLAVEQGKYKNGVIPPAALLPFVARARAIDSVHGVGMHAFGLEQHWARGLQKEAAVNLMVASAKGLYGTTDSSRVAAMFGKSYSNVMSEHYDEGITSLAREGGYPALAASVDGTGLMDPLATSEAAQEFVRLAANPGVRGASGDATSDTFKRSFSNALRGRDPVLAERAHSVYAGLMQQGLTKEQLRGYFLDDNAENMFWAAQSLSQGGRGIQDIYRGLIERPFDAKAIAKVAQTGRIDLASVAASYGAPGRPEEIEKKMFQARSKAILDTADRRRWYKGDATVAMDSNELAQFDALVLDQFQIQMRSRGALDIDAAISAVAGQTGKFLLVPGSNGAFQAVRDPFEGRGRTMLQPLNDDPSHPLSRAKGYAPIYAPGVRMQNALGEQEDLVVTWAEDAAEAHKSFPGKIPEHEALHLERPNTAGLSAVKMADGRPVQFMPGESLAFRVSGTSVLNDATGYEKRKVPLDPKEAGEFFKQHLGPGWYAVRDGGDTPSGQAYTLYYGGRLKVGENEREAEIRKREVLRSNPRPQGVTVLPGGAAVTYPQMPRGRNAP